MCLISEVWHSLLLYGHQIYPHHSLLLLFFCEQSCIHRVADNGKWMV